MSDLSKLMSLGLPAREILELLAPHHDVPAEATEIDIWNCIAQLLEPPSRKKLPQYNTIEDAINLIKKSSNILVLSGAGISTSAGLPDFRSRDGIYVQIHEQHPDLIDPKSIFDITYFRQNPLPFYQFAKALFPGQFKPTVGHRFIKCLEDHKKLLRNYTQNIDTLEKQAGIKRVVECHGSFATATCTNCKYSIDGLDIKDDVFAQRVPQCPVCRENSPIETFSVMKPDIVFFGEQLGKEFHESFESDRNKADLLIVIGSSLKVRPVALIPKHVPHDIPQILINRERLEHMYFDVELLGDCDHIIQELCHRMSDGWTHLCETQATRMKQIEGINELVVAEQRARKQPDEKADLSSSGAASKSDDKNEELDDSDQTTEYDCEWEDVEVLEDPSLGIHPKVDLSIPDDTFIHLKPNKYFFKGAELTRSQLDALTSQA